MNDFVPQQISSAQRAAIESGKPAILALLATGKSPLSSLARRGNYYSLLLAEAQWEFEQSVKCRQTE